jgi:nucleoside-diphosphate-sugar epimerase
LQNTVFITGGTGFLGAYIIKELVQKGYRVRALRRSHALPFFIDPVFFTNVQWVMGDVLDVPLLEEAMNEADIVVHVAAKVSFDNKERDAMYKTNVEGTANVVNAALLKKVKRLVQVSSVAALGRTVNGITVNEQKKWEKSDGNTHYGISKYLGEIEVWRGIGEGLNAVIVNPSTILGFGDWNNSSCAIFKNVYQQFPWYTNGINGFVGVEDVAKATIQLMESNISAQRFIINGDNWSFRQLFTTIAQAFNKRPPYREATTFLAGIAWRLEKIKSLLSKKTPLLTRESARVAQSKTYFSIDKLKQALPGFEFTPLQQVIESACSQYLAHSKSAP